ncbi:hypothetical protein Tco_0806487 [Tanacetum coccineum]
MSNMSEDIQYAGSDTCPPMLDRTDFESWQQRICLYCLGKDNGENIMKSITEGPVRARVFTNLSAQDKERYKADIRATNILLQVSNASVQQYPTQSSMSPRSSNEPSPVDNFQLDSGSSSTDNLIESLTNTLALLNQSFKAHLPQTNNQLRTSSNARNKATVQDGRVGVQDDSDYFKDKMLLMNAHENGAVLDEEQLLFLAGEQVTNFDDDVDDLALNVDHVFEADQCDAFDFDVDEAPTTQTIFMENLTSEEAGPSYDSNIPSEVQDREYDSDCEDKYHEVHEMQSDVQHNYVVDSDADYTSDSNIIPYDQYVEDNEEHVVQSNVSSVK